MQAQHWHSQSLKSNLSVHNVRLIGRAGLSRGPGYLQRYLFVLLKRKPKTFAEVRRSVLDKAKVGPGGAAAHVRAVTAPGTAQDG